MMSEEFDEQEVLDLVDRALAENSFQSERTLPLAYNEGRLLEVLSERLSKYMERPDVQMILDDLRGELYSGISLGEIKTLHAMAKNCRKCPLMIPEPQMPKWNLTDPDVIFVLDQPPFTNDAVGVLVDALKSSGFSSQRVLLTYVNRCRPREGKITPEEVRNCLPYLHTEIQLLRPKMVVTLGAMPTAAVFGGDMKISEERGKICWLGPWAIMPTYSPMYVLKGADHLRTTFYQDISRAYDFAYGEK